MEPSPVGLSVDWVLPLGEAGPVTAALHALTAVVRSEHGCLKCTVSMRVGAHTTIRYTGAWRNEEDLKAHVLSERFARLAQLIASASATPRVEFRLPTGKRGLHYAADLRDRR